MSARPVNALLAAAICIGVAACVAVAAFHVGAAARLDVRVLEGFGGLAQPEARDLATLVTKFTNRRGYAVAVVIVLAVALLRGRARLAAAVAAVFLGANVTTQLLKPVVASPRPPPWLPEAIWPSGHATAAMALALCVVLVAPPRLRPLAAAAGALGATVTGYSLMVIGHHLPSDVLGGMLVAGTWTGLAIAALLWRRAGEPAVRWRRALASAVLATALALALVLVVVEWTQPLRLYVTQRTTFLAGAALIAAVAAALTAAASLAPLTARAPSAPPPPRERP